MNNHNFIYNGNELFTFGDNVLGQLGLGDNENKNKPTLLMQDKTIRQIICGEVHSFILKNNGKLLVFGNNIHGELGLGDNVSRNIPTLLARYKYSTNRLRRIP